jgi:ribosomal protein L40E
MSEENVELVRRVYIEGDLLQTTSEQIDRLFREYLDEDFEFRLPGDYPEGEPVFRGREGVDQLVAMLGETWSEWQLSLASARSRRLARVAVAPRLVSVKGVVRQKPACRHCGATLEHTISKCPKCGRRSLLSLLLPRRGKI